MSPRKDPRPYLKDPQHYPESQTSQDKECHEEEGWHPPEEPPNPYLNLHLQAKPELRPDSETHTNIPHDELLLHLNDPSPKMPTNNVTQLGREITKTLHFVRFY